MPANSVLLALALAASGDVQTDPRQCGTLLPGWLNQAQMVSLQAVTNKLDVLSDGTLRWNGSPVSADEVGEYVAIVPHMNPQPLTVLDIATGAPCDAVRMVRQLIDSGAKCSSGAVCGEGTGPAPHVRP